MSGQRRLYRADRTKGATVLGHLPRLLLLYVFGVVDFVVLEWDIRSKRYMNELSGGQSLRTSNQMKNGTGRPACRIHFSGLHADSFKNTLPVVSHMVIL